MKTYLAQLLQVEVPLYTLPITENVSKVEPCEDGAEFGWEDPGLLRSPSLPSMEIVT